MWDVVFAVCLVAATSTPIGTPVPADSARASYAGAEALRHYVQGRLLEERGDFNEALGQFYRALLLDSHATGAALKISELSARIGENDRSLEFAERALRLEPGRARGLWLRGPALFNLGQGEEALKFLQSAAEADSNDADYQRSLAHVAEELNHLDVVARACARAVFLDEDDAESWFQLAAADARLGEFESADQALSRAVELNPLRPGNLFLQGLIQEGLGRDSQAIELYRRHLKIHGGDQVTRRRLVNLLARSQRYAEAYTEARAAAAGRPDDDQAKEVEADLAFRAKRTAEAIKLTDRMRARAGDDPDRRARSALALTRRWEAAHPGDLRGALLTARTLAVAGRTDSAIAKARMAVAAAPDSSEPRILLARLLQDAKRYPEAAAAWSEVVNRFPFDVDVHLELAFCREQVGDIDGAQRTVRDALAREPDNPSVLNFLGYLLADHNQDLDEAAGLIGRALRLEPANGAFIDSMGWVYYRLGRLADARRQLERAVRLTGGDPIVHEHLGDVYKDMRLIDLARDEYRKSLAGDGSNDRVRAKLEEIR
jgi:tetratricopeptide (TPR) repeat protein